MRGAKHTNFRELRKVEVQVEKHGHPKIHLPKELAMYFYGRNIVLSQARVAVRLL
jgi:hypothetical protein